MAARLQFPMEALTSRLNLGSRFDGVRSQSLTSRFSNLKPIGDFLDVKRISKPANFSEVQNRVNFNLSYFSSNYMAVFAMLAIYTLLSSPLLFFVIVMVIGGMWGIGRLEGRDLDLGFIRASVSQLYTALICIAVPLGFIANPFSAALWLIGASGVSILGHAAFMDKPIEPHERLTGPESAHFRRRKKHGKASKHLDDSDDDTVRLSSYDPAYYAQAAGDYANYTGDQLEFTGYDLGSARRSGGQEMIPDDVSLADYEDQWEVERQRYTQYLRNMKARDKELVKSANDKLRHARERGKTRASLTQDEVEALERRRLQEKDEPAKDRRTSSSRSSRSTSATNLNVDKTRRKSSSSRFFSSPAANSSRTRVPKSPKPSRPTSSDAPGPVPQAGPGFIVAGPDGQQVYAPLPYGTSSPYTRAPDARTASGQYIPYSPRYFTPQEHRPSSSARRSPTDELHMPHNRTRASSSVDHTAYRPSSGGRRNVSGPAGMQYDRLRRMTPASPVEEIASPFEGFEERRLGERSGSREEGSDSAESVVVVEKEGSESEGSEEGVEVRVERDGYRIERVPVGAKGKGRDRDRDRGNERDRDRDRGTDRERERERRRKKRS